MNDIGTLNMLTGLTEAGDSLINAFTDISQSNFVAKQFQFNEQMANIQSEEAITQGREQQEVSQERTAQLSGEQQAAEAAQGADVHTGTANITKTQTGEIGALDYLTIGTNAFMKSLGYQIQGENDKSEAWQAESAGLTKAGNSLLTGGEELYQSQMKAIAYDQQEKAIISSGSGSESSIWNDEGTGLAL